MPTVDNVTTKTSEIAWQSPDKQRTIHKVTLDVKGQPFETRTYSDAIAAVGWSGTVETYEVPGKGDYPPQTFVKQPQKEGFSGGGRSGGGGGSFKRDNDPFTMYLSYAKDLMVARIASGLEKETYPSQLQDILTGGHVLFEGRPGAVTPTSPTLTPPTEAKDIANLFEGAEPVVVPNEELPWQPKS